MKQVFKYMIKRPNELQKEILKDLMWHTTKVYNIMLYIIINDQTDIPDRIEKITSIQSICIHIHYNK